MLAQFAGRTDIAIECDGVDAEFISKVGTGCVPVRHCGLCGPDLRFREGEAAPFQLALREPCVRAPVRRTALVMLQHHGGRLSCRRHEHKALKTRNTFGSGSRTQADVRSAIAKMRCISRRTGFSISLPSTTTSPVSASGKASMIRRAWAMAVSSGAKTAADGVRSDHSLAGCRRTASRSGRPTAVNQDPPSGNKAPL